LVAKRFDLSRYRSFFAGLFSAQGIKYLEKWVAVGVLIGLVCGAAALAFFWSIGLLTNLLLTQITGYIPPKPAGEGLTHFTLPTNPLLLPLVTGLGGLLSGLIVYSLAPEAEGHGTDAAIHAFHYKKGEIRSRVPVVKLIASALTIGSGGSAGREGPIAQIGAGFGSLVGRILHLDEREKRITLVAGLAAGLGAIFKAPFGGALLACEILYLSDFEVDALIPSFIASTVGYSLFASVTGWTPVFGQAASYSFHDPATLPLYGVLGVLCGLVGILYVKCFYGVNRLFAGLKVPSVVKPALGGLLVGVIGIFLPQVLGTGYGWLQLALEGRIEAPPLFFLLIALIKIVATSLSIGSGGSGGVFAPALVIGGFLGAFTHSVFSPLLPQLQLTAAPFIVVGMMAFFGGVGKAPVAVILMISEMTGSYYLLVPSMIATSIAYIVTGSNSIYRSQLPSRLHSPAHKMVH